MADRWDDYFNNAKMLKPELEQIDGFVDNVRYRSLIREGWILSLSDWRDEKSVVRWRTHMGHHFVQERGRSGIFEDYRLRVGQVTQDTKIPEGFELREQRLDETEVGEGTAVTLIEAKRPSQFAETSNPHDCAEFLGFEPYAAGIVDYDVFEAVLTPGDLILLVAWRDAETAKGFEDRLNLREGARFRSVRVIRDYGMFDRREATQFYPDVTRR